MGAEQEAVLDVLFPGDSRISLSSSGPQKLLILNVGINVGYTHSRETVPWLWRSSATPEFEAYLGILSSNLVVLNTPRAVI